MRNAAAFPFALLPSLAAALAVSACAGLGERGGERMPEPTYYEARDYASLETGATIDGPFGQALEASFEWQDSSLGDLTSRVDCPPGVDPCDPAAAPPGAIYTYVHRVTPGADSPNDEPFPQPEVTRRFDGVESFSTSFAPPGFTGVAGYSFGDAEAALGRGGRFVIERRADDGGLTWRAVGGTEEWGTGETVTFFYQTTRPPKGPGGGFLLEGGPYRARGVGPVPQE